MERMSGVVGQTTQQYFDSVEIITHGFRPNDKDPFRVSNLEQVGVVERKVPMVVKKAVRIRFRADGLLDDLPTQETAKGLVLDVAVAPRTIQIQQQRVKGIVAFIELI